MKPVDQTTFGADIGNCFAACVASLLELPLDDVPNFCAAPERWFEVLADWLRPLGFFPLMFKLDVPFVPPGLYILGGKSPRGSFLHAVIARGEEIVHDPHPSRAGVESRVDATLFVPMDPVQKAARAGPDMDAALAKLDLSPCTATAHDAGTGQTLTCAMLAHGPDEDHVADGMRWRDGEAPKGFMGGGR